MKRIKHEGQVLSKFDIAWLLDKVHYRLLPWTVIYDSFTYSELVEFYNDCFSGCSSC